MSRICLLLTALPFLLASSEVAAQDETPAGWVRTLEGTGTGRVCATDQFPDRQEVVCIEDQTRTGRVLARSTFGPAVALDSKTASVELDTHGVDQHPCFDPTHGHSLGGGDFQAASQNVLAGYLQRELCKSNHEIILHR